MPSVTPIERESAVATWSALAVSALATPKSVTTADAAGEQHVVRLDVAVHDAARVRVGQRARHVAQDPDRIDDRQLAVPQQPVAQRFAGRRTAW